MPPNAKISNDARRLLTKRLRAYLEILKARFAGQAEGDLARAEERYRGRNAP
jgi:hypothetical protein